MREEDLLSVIIPRKRAAEKRKPEAENLMKGRWGQRIFWRKLFRSRQCFLRGRPLILEIPVD